MAVFRDADGTVAGILCTRGAAARRFCWQCSNAGDYLCDGPGKRWPKTCDRPMCDQHRTHRGEDYDVCSEHSKDLPPQMSLI